MQPNAPGTQGYNRCAYAANNPATWTDPTGHDLSSGDCQLVFGAAWALVVGTFGWLIGKHQQGAYYLRIFAIYSAAGSAAIGFSHAYPDLRSLMGQWGGSLLVIGGFMLGIQVLGNPHLSTLPALAILLAGVLLLLAALAIEAVIQWALDYNDIPGWLCHKKAADGSSVPTSTGKFSPAGGDLAGAQAASSSLPALPTVIPPRPHRPIDTVSRP